MSSLDALRVALARAAGKNERLVGAFAIAPRAPNVVYLAEFNQLAISRDGGKTWNAVAGTTSSRVSALAISSANPDIIYAGTESLDLYKSTDGGTTWVAMNQGLGLAPGVRLSVTALAIDPQNPARVYAARGAWVGTSAASLLPLGVMLSVDGGASWQNVNLPATQAAVTRLVISDNHLYAATPDQVVSIRI